MSQFYFSSTINGEKIEVLAGWDRPLQEYFMTVFHENGDVLWSSVDHPDKTNDLGIEVLRIQLFRLNVAEVPPQLWIEVLKSGGSNEGNVICNFTKVGEIWEFDRVDLERKKS